LDGLGSFIKYKNRKIKLLKIKSAYIDYTELQEVYHFSRLRFTPKERVFLSRWIQALDALESIIPKWYPCVPSKLKFEIQNKYNDSILAQNLGLKIPKMILTNDVDEAKDYIQKNRTIFKETGIHFYSNNKNQLFYFHADVVTKNSKDLIRITKTPCLFQEYIEKEKEVRAVVVGQKVFAVQIESQKNKRSQVNWKGEEENLEFSVCKLPRAIQRKLVKLTANIGFQMATIDLIIAPNNQYYFIEINRPGQWLFLELLSGAQISNELIKQLK
jgi:glutathione synthase/RimK-type ligase-like ATP-grasp enzyme